MRKFTSGSLAKDVASAQELHLLINALSHVVSHLDRRHATLVNAIISLSWASMDATFVKSYITFMGLLLSAQSQYGATVLEKAVQGLTHRESYCYNPVCLTESRTEVDIAAVRLAGTNHLGKKLTRGDLYDRHHALLEHVLSIVPTLIKSLQPIIARKFPHKRLEKIYHVTYVRNMLRLAQYCPGLEDQILSSVVERAIQIDVRQRFGLLRKASY